MKTGVRILLSSIVIFLISCHYGNKRETEIVEVDFKENRQLQKSDINLDTIPILYVAVSAIISPRETFSYYSELFEYISKNGTDAEKATLQMANVARSINNNSFFKI